MSARSSSATSRAEPPRVFSRHDVGALEQRHEPRRGVGRVADWRGRKHDCSTWNSDINARLPHRLFSCLRLRALPCLNHRALPPIMVADWRGRKHDCSTWNSDINARLPHRLFSCLRLRALPCLNHRALPPIMPAAARPYANAFPQI